jgi:tetratricopeptide (TPR) repeat protein
MKSLVHAVLKLLCAVSLMLSVMSALSQQGGGAHPNPAQSPVKLPSQSSATSQPDTFPTAMDPWDQNEIIQRSNTKPVSSKIADGDNCFLPPLNGPLPATVEVSDLQIPAKARREHWDGCAALKNNKIADAENHLRKAVKQWPKYWSAWVVLGQVLQTEQKTKEARDACSQPLASSVSYLPAYLCLADISARSESWDKVLALSIRALTIDPTTVAVAYDYNAAANLHLHNLHEAERSALRAAEIDKSNTDPRVHFLLAQIYEAKGDRLAEAVQLREYLKYASNPDDAAMVRKYLANLDQQTK